MVRKVGVYEIPFDASGNQQHYGTSGGSWQPNHTFEGRLTLLTFSRGRSSAYFHFERDDGRTVTVFLKDLLPMMRVMNNGVVRGKFSFVKRGENYGCCLVEEDGTNS